MYTPEYYTGYMSGGAYLLRTALIPKLLQAALTTPIIHMEDIYVTGLVARSIGVYPENSRLFNFKRTEPDYCLSKKTVRIRLSRLESTYVFILSN